MLLKVCRNRIRFKDIPKASELSANIFLDTSKAMNLSANIYLNTWKAIDLSADRSDDITTMVNLSADRSDDKSMKSVLSAKHLGNIRKRSEISAKKYADNTNRIFGGFGFGRSKNLLYFSAVIIIPKPMKVAFTPQFKLEDLYITPFTGKRYFDPQTGKAYYKPVERNMTPTGVHMLDRFLQCVCTSKCYTLRSLQEQIGVSKQIFSGLCFPLTGLKFEELHETIRLRVADDLLRYSTLEKKDIALRCGFSSNPAMYKMFQRVYKCGPGQRQRHLRQPGDEGAWKV